MKHRFPDTKCGQHGCENEAVGEAYYLGTDKWFPYCEVHLSTRKLGGMKIRHSRGQTQ